MIRYLKIESSCPWDTLPTLQSTHLIVVISSNNRERIMSNWPITTSRITNPKASIRPEAIIHPNFHHQRPMSRSTRIRRAPTCINPSQTARTIPPATTLESITYTAERLMQSLFLRLHWSKNHNHHRHCECRHQNFQTTSCLNIFPITSTTKPFPHRWDDKMNEIDVC